MRLFNPSLLAPAVASLCVAPCYATEYLTIKQAQHLGFPGADNFVVSDLILTKDQRKLIKNTSGVRQRWDVQRVWRAEKNGALLGWFIIDDVVGKHEFITYAASLSPSGQVINIDILVYLETYGDQIRDEEWRDVFVGKTRESELQLGTDIPNISGATLSCRNVTDGVKRLLVIHDLFLRTIDGS